MTRTWTTRDQDLLAVGRCPSRTRDVVRARVALIPARVIRIDFHRLPCSVPKCLRRASESGRREGHDQAES